MSIIETISDVDNSFLSRRELICNFSGLGGKLNKLEAVDMVTKEFKLDGKLIIPMKLENHVGKPLITGTFFVYEDENLSKTQVNPTIFTRLEKAKKKVEEAVEAPKEEAVEAPKEEAVEAPKEEAVEAPKEEEKSE